MGYLVTYTAPISKPAKNPVDASVTFVRKGKKVIGVSSITVGVPTWSGTISWKLSGALSRPPDTSGPTGCDNKFQQTTTITGSGALTIEGSHLRSAKCEYTRTDTDDFSRICVDPACSVSIMDHNERKLSGTIMTETSGFDAQVRYVTNKDWQISFDIPSFPLDGTETLHHTETHVAGTNVYCCPNGVCMSTSDPTPTPLTGLSRRETIMLTGGMNPVDPNHITGQQAVELPPDPVHRYEVTYDFARK
jgi:hypothetical protein